MVRIVKSSDPAQHHRQTDDDRARQDRQEGPAALMREVELGVDLRPSSG